MIRVFHGFLGSPEDFSFLAGEGVILHDLYQEIPETDPEDLLIGYSMGGRLAMELARRNGFKKMILINAHPGLKSAEEKIVRSQWEDEVIERLGSPEFLSWWNALPIFEADRPITGVPAGSKEIFEKMRLSRQENFLPFLRENSFKVHWILGALDPKYSILAKELEGFSLTLLPGGHRLFQNPEILRPAIEAIL